MSITGAARGCSQLTLVEICFLVLSSSFVCTHGCKNLNPKKQPGHPKRGKEDPQQIEASGSSMCSLRMHRAIEDYGSRHRRWDQWLSKDWETQLLGSAFPDEDRLSKRKSIGETISLQVEVESRNSPEREEVSSVSTLGAKVRQSPLQGIKGAAEMSSSSTSIFLLTLILCTSLVFPAKRVMFFYHESII